MSEPQASQPPNTVEPRLEAAGRLRHQTLSGSSLTNLVRLLGAYRREIDRWDKAAYCLVLSALLGPVHVLQNVVARRRIPAGPPPPPVFVVGHWRAGTTHVHNLLALDPDFGFLSTAQAMLPDVALLWPALARGIVRRLAPEKRPMDEMAFAPELPQEDEFALLNRTRHCFYVSTVFPRRLVELVDRYCLMDTATAAEKAAWAREYHRLLREVSWLAGGRRPVCKNPVNTGRLPHVLEVFPDAQFVHVVRNPFEVFPSTMHLQRSLIRTSSLQDYDDDEAREPVFEVFEKVMRRYLRDRDRVPTGQLVEVRYEDVVGRPVETLAGVYKGLGLRWDGARERKVREYLAGMGGYRTNRYALDEATAAEIATRWGFAIDAFGYG